MSKPIVVIGAGICGISCALWLRRSGHEVLLLDKSEPGMGASYGNAGLLAQWALVPVNEPSIWKNLPKYLIDPMGPLFVKWRYLPQLTPWLIAFLKNATSTTSNRTSEALVPLLSDAVEQHKSLTEGTKAQNWIADSKFSYAYRNRTAFEQDATGWAIKSAAGMKPDVLTGSEVQDEEPICGPMIQCLAVLKGQGHILNPHGYVLSLVNALEEVGGKCRKADVLDFERDGHKLTAVITNTGRIECDKAVLTAGIWSKSLAAKLGLKVPLETERGYHVMYKSPSEMPRNPMMMTIGKFAVTPMAEGLRCAGTVELGGIKLGPSKAPIRLIRRRVSEVFPNLTYEKSEEWMGFRPTTPDNLPLIGEIAQSGIYTAFGHQHVGLTAGAKTGRLISDIVSQRMPNIDMSPYDPNRYAAR